MIGNEHIILKKIIEHPITSHALLEMLIEDGVKVTPMPTTFSERKVVLWKIVEELNRRESQAEDRSE